jgi:hypothetical protein
MMTSRVALVVRLSRLVIVLSWHLNGMGTLLSTVMSDAYDAYSAMPLGGFCSAVSDSNRLCALRVMSRCRRENPPAGWQNAPAINPKMRRGLSGLSVCCKVGEHTRTRGFRVVQAAGA